MQKVVVIKKDDSIYPDRSDLFRPHEAYPEYPFSQNVSKGTNDVYEMIREAFASLGLDKDNFGSEQWNPLGKYVFPGDNVLIKPNLVMDINYNERGGTECLYTQPSVVAAIIDYVIIALKGSGKIIVGDAPLQECVFDNLVSSSGYTDLIDFYKTMGVDISLADFRNTKTVIEGKVHREQKNEGNADNGVLVKFDKDSAFNEFDEDKIKRLRVTNYDPRILQEHHKVKKHEYLIAKKVLDADVIINVPKPKTHRKAGITAALKNLIGINACKEYLPHHTNGSADEGGDCYKHTNPELQKANELLDKKNMLITEHKYDEARAAIDEFEKHLQDGRGVHGERYWEGSWYGNDTIWRTIADLNRILVYADKSGKICDTKQRRYFAVGDMVVSGHREGPLHPSPIDAHTIVAAEDPLAFDRTVCAIMGFDYHLVSSLNGRFITDGRLIIANNEEPIICSNNDVWDGKKPSEITKEDSIKFIPSQGWECVLGNPLKAEFVKRIKDSRKPVIMFGAGKYGTLMAGYLCDDAMDIDVECFFDSDPSKWGKKVFGNIECREPKNVGGAYVCVICALARNIPDIEKSAVQYGFADIICFPK